MRAEPTPTDWDDISGHSLPLKRKSSPMSERQCPHAADGCPHTIEAADHAVKKVFAILGVDIDRPESVEEFREDLRFGKKMRKAADHGFLALMGVLAAAMMAAVWSGVLAKVGGGH